MSFSTCCAMFRGSPSPKSFPSSFEAMRPITVSALAFRTSAPAASSEMSSSASSPRRPVDSSDNTFFSSSSMSSFWSGFSWSRLTLVCSSLQLMSGSYTNASSTAITLSLCVRKTLMTASHVERKFPSMPLTSIALMSMRVRRNGIFSGNFSRCMATSKQSPKSMWMILPLNWSRRRLHGCRSPSPRMYPTIDITASDRV
mmetsp:Transcript_9780/g.19107  ORF Transcript_9780/g.19107 Transcript_9780/m.19107 type:complete len:200 (-) Transcript_9780:486-1085(-)